MSEESLTLREKLAFGLSAIPDQTTYQAFGLFVFTFYFTIVDLGNLVWIGFIIWTIWNMVNDPLLGALSDRTKHRGKWGKRKFYLTISIVPLGLTMIFLFIVPFTTETKIVEFMYFIFIIVLFEFFYTLFDVNVNSLFPEMFPTEEKRAQANVFIKGLTVIAIIFASLPTLILQPLAPITGTPEELASIKQNYIIAGIMLAAITIIFAIPFLLKGVKEKEEKQEVFEKRPKFFESLKFTLRNKTFVHFVIANTMVWYVFNTLITIFPLFFTYVVEVGTETYWVTLALVLALVVAALVLPIHKKLGSKMGMRNAFMITLGTWILLLIPFLFLSSGDKIFGVIIAGIQGFALSGCLFYVDILHGDVIDEDAVKFGVKRSASYYGINALIHRISTILTILTIGLVFQGTEWAGGYQINPGTDVIIGLKLIIMLFPAIGCAVAILFLKLYSLHGPKLEQMRAELQKHPELKLK